MTAPAAMTIRKLGPGTLTIGSAGSPIDFSQLCTNAQVTWGVKAGDAVEVLSGDTVSGDREYTATLEATVYQDDLTAGGLVDYSWAHKGDEVPFAFTPYSGSRSITGVVIVDPLDVGGDIGKKNTSSIKWACVGEPELVDDLS